MKKAILLAILCTLIILWYRLCWIPVHLTLPEPYRYSQSSDNLVYFWAAKRHQSFFKVGNAYQIDVAGQKVQLELFSITYATSKPNEMKLGFYPAKDNALELGVDQYRATGLL